MFNKPIIFLVLVKSSDLIVLHNYFSSNRNCIKTTFFVSMAYCYWDLTVVNVKLLIILRNTLITLKWLPIGIVKLTFSVCTIKFYIKGNEIPYCSSLYNMKDIWVQSWLNLTINYVHFVDILRNTNVLLNCILMAFSYCHI